MTFFKLILNSASDFIHKYLFLWTLWSIIIDEFIPVSAVLIGSRRLMNGSSSPHNNNEIFFRNISQILDDLLKDYDNSQHPNYKDGRPTTIRTNIYIRSMGPISELDMDYSMDCYFRQSWRDGRLRFKGPVDKLSLSIKMLERLWRPDTYFHNGKNSYVHTITLPNKLLRITQEGDILYSMRLTIKAKCPMCLRNFPMDTQSCPLVIGSYAYTSKHIVYVWDSSNNSVGFVPGMALSQFDLISHLYQNSSMRRMKEGDIYSVLQVNFIMERHTGYFLIQVYLPCGLIVILSWVSFWINREATSDRVGLGITAVLTLSTISLDSRTDLPKVHYATALDWFLIMSFAYCMATLLEFAGVHYFTKIGSGEAILSDDGDEDDEEEEEEDEGVEEGKGGEDSEWEEIVDDTFGNPSDFAIRRPINCTSTSACNVRPQGSELQAQYGWGSPFPTPPPNFDQGVGTTDGGGGQPISITSSFNLKSVACKETQTEKKLSFFRQFLKCFLADQEFRRERQRAASLQSSMNSVSRIDRISRVLFPMSFMILNIVYWIFYTHRSDECPGNSMVALGLGHKKM